MKTFKDFPEFKPNLSPNQVLKMGSFGGTYFRPIKSSILNRTIRSKEAMAKIPKEYFESVDLKTQVTSSTYDKNENKYKVKCGSSLQEWENNGWINKQNPYGWFQWYCHFYNDVRTPDDERQIKRWMRFAGPNGRWRKALMNQIIKKKTEHDDYSISPVIRQSLQHWAYKLNKKDFDSFRNILLVSNLINSTAG